MTTKQKIAAYKWCLLQLKTKYPHYHNNGDPTVAPYVCDLLRQYYNEHIGTNYNREWIVTTYFNEFMECKPNDKESCGWWPETDIGILQRTIAIQWCIDTITSK